MLGIHILVLESFPSRFLVSSIRHSLFYYLYMGVLILIERRGSSDSLLRGRSKALVVMRLYYSLFLERRSVLFPLSLLSIGKRNGLVRYRLLYAQGRKDPLRKSLEVRTGCSKVLTLRRKFN